MILVSYFNMLGALRNVSNVVEFKDRETPVDALNEILRPSELIIPWSSVRVLPGPTHYLQIDQLVITDFRAQIPTNTALHTGCTFCR